MKVFENPTTEELKKIFLDVVWCKTLITKREKDGFVKYYNLPCATDIETTSFTEGDSKRGIAYAFTFGIGEYIITYREWSDYLSMFKTLKECLGLSTSQRVICFIHNLSFEFGFFIKRFKWTTVFATDKHRPLKAVSEDGVEFRCSARVSGYTLAKLAENLTSHKIEKRVGDLDYRKMRHSKTPLTDEEKGYNIADVEILLYWIEEKINEDGDITKIPLTNTGYVREHLRKHCTYLGSTKEQKRTNKEQKKYRKMIKTLTLDTEEYLQCKRLEVGGYVHAEALNCDKLFDTKLLEHISKTRRIINAYLRIKAADYSSSYPAVMSMSPQYPMSKGERVDITTTGPEFYEYLDLYCCSFYAHFYNLEPIFTEQYISKNKCMKLKGYTDNNNKIVSATEVMYPCNELSWRIIEKCYKWERVEISSMIVYRKGYLPKLLIEGILDLYADKTLLKGVKGKEVEYMRKKGMLNACFGMILTDICHDEISLTLDESELWNVSEVSVSDSIEQYNKSPKRFLFFPWGIWVCYIAQYNLWSAIFELGSDRLYSDTDSVKYIDLDGKHQKYFEDYNKKIDEKIKDVCEYYGLDENKFKPKTIKGKEKPLGYWDKEDDMSAFKTLGAKRYMYELTNEDKGYKTLHLTLSGVNNQKGLPYMILKSGVEHYVVDKEGNVLDENDEKQMLLAYEYRFSLSTDTSKVFDMFTDGLFFPQNSTGKLAHVYNEKEIDGELTDYLGNTAPYHEETSVWLGELEFSLGMDESIKNILTNTFTRIY